MPELLAYVVILVLAGLQVSEALPETLGPPALLVQVALLGWVVLRDRQAHKAPPVRWAQRARQVQRDRQARRALREQLARKD